MSLRFLLVLSDRSLPYSTFDQLEIKHIEILHAANIVRAEIPTFENGRFISEAIVQSITSLGFELVDSMRRNGCDDPLAASQRGPLAPGKTNVSLFRSIVPGSPTFSGSTDPESRKALG